MKALRALVVFLFAFSSLQAQITFSSADVQGVFAAGKYWQQFSNDTANTTMNVGIATMGIAQSWSFPTVVLRDTFRLDNVNPATTPYASSFSRATHAQRENLSIAGFTSISYQYNRITADSLIELGGVDSVQGLPVQIRTQYRLDFLLPISVGQAVSVRDSQFTGNNSWQIQTRTSTVDAYGTLTVPAGSFQALRRQEFRISKNYSNGLLSSTDTSISYLWLTKDNYFLSVDPKYAYQASGTIPIQRIQYMRVVTTTNVFDPTSSPPSRFEVLQNYPNPFNPSTIIQYELASRSSVRLAVYNTLGQEVALLVNGEQAAGPHSVVFDGKNLTSGIYFYRLSASGNVKIGRMTLLK